MKKKTIGRELVPQNKIIKFKKPGAVKKTDEAMKLDASLGMEKMIVLAIDKNFDIERLEKIRQIIHEEQERLAKQLFDYHFAQLQAAYIEPAKKSKNVNNKEGKFLFAYAPIEVLQKAYHKIITDHGFSYTWNEIEAPAGIVGGVMTIAGHGYEKTIKAFCPLLEKDQTFMTPHKLHEGTFTLVRRATFSRGFGLIIEGGDPEQISEELKDARSKNRAFLIKNMIPSQLFTPKEIADYQTEGQSAVNDAGRLYDITAMWQNLLKTRSKK
jgi:hypothetical protein